MKDIVFFRGKILSVFLDMPEDINKENFDKDLKSAGVRLWFGIKEKDIKHLHYMMLVRMLESIGTLVRGKVEEWKKLKDKQLNNLLRKRGN